MSILGTYTQRSLLRNKARSFSTLVGVVLAAGLLCAIFTTVTSLYSALITRTVETEGAWQIFDFNAEEGFAGKLAQESRVDRAAMSLELGSCFINDAYFNPYLTVRTMPIALKGDNESVRELFTMPTIVEGRFPTSEHEIILPEEFRGYTFRTPTAQQASMPQEADASHQGSESQESSAVQQTGAAQETNATQETSAGQNVSSAMQDFWASSDEPCALGAHISLPIGTVMLPNGERLFSLENNATEVWENFTYFQEGSLVDGEISETISTSLTLQDQTPYDFEIVGFYEDQYYERNDFSASGASLSSVTALIGGQPQTYTNANVWVSTQGFLSRAELKEFAASVFGEEDYFFHGELLSYLGLTPELPVWNSLWRFAAALALIIIITAVSLIYNSFAISLSERTRQFGLLGSLGASKNQLATTVLLEATLISLIGIPLGIALGLVGVALTLKNTARAFYGLLDIPLDRGLPLAVEPRIIALVVGLCAGLVLISAAVPALRVRRVSASDALRQIQDIHLDRVSTAQLKRKGVLHTSLLEAMTGVYGLLAHRNLKRQAKRSWSLVASLAISVALFVLAGSIRGFLAPFASLSAFSYGANQGIDYVASFYYSSETQDINAVLEQVKEALAPLDDAYIATAYHTTYTHVVLEDNMVAEELLDALLLDRADVQEVEELGFNLKRSYCGYAQINYVNDAEWADMARVSGLDDSYVASLFAQIDEGNLAALAVNTLMLSRTDDTYIYVSPFQREGSVRLIKIAAQEGYDISYLTMRDDRPALACIPLINEAEVLEDAANEESATNEGTSTLEDSATGEADMLETDVLENAETEEDGIIYLDLNQADIDEISFDVCGLLDPVPESLITINEDAESFPIFVLPLSALPQTEEFRLAESGSCIVGLSATDTERGIDTGRLEQILWGLINGPLDESGISLVLVNVKEEYATQVAIIHMINLFIFLFALITMLIAITNVFNTLTNGIVLRTREFAVLMSCGMDSAGLAKMLIGECLGYAVRGFAAGLLLSGASVGLLFRITQESFIGMTLPIPWLWIAGAFVGVAGLLGGSVAFALRRNNVLNIVEALRGDSA